jgi:uncharacterized protein (TIGR02466 family)
MALELRESLQLWPTPVGTFHVDDAALLGHLHEEILSRAAVLPTVARGERTGWQSASDLLAWTPAMRGLGGLFADAVAKMAPGAAVRGVDAAAWANVLLRGDYVTPHTHAGSAWSAVLYVDAGDSDEQHGGFLSVRDPRAGAAMVITEANAHDSACTFHLYPRTGMLIVFPAWLVHWVAPYQGTRARISVAANLR